MSGSHAQRMRATCLLVAAAVAVLLAGCAAGGSGSGDTTTQTPTSTVPTNTAPPATSGTVLEPLDDGEYSAAVYDPSAGTVAGDDGGELEAGTLVDLGGGCLGLEDDDGERRIVAFPVGTTLDGGRVSAVGMDAFGLGQPLRYLGADGRTDAPVFSLALPDGCPADVTDVWYFVVPSSTGIGSPGDD